MAQIMLAVNMIGKNVYLIGYIHISDIQNEFLRHQIVDHTGISWYYMRSEYNTFTILTAE